MTDMAAGYYDSWKCFPWKRFPPNISIFRRGITMSSWSGGERFTCFRPSRCGFTLLRPFSYHSLQYRSVSPSEEENARGS